MANLSGGVRTMVLALARGARGPNAGIGGTLIRAGVCDSLARCRQRGDVREPIRSRVVEFPGRRNC